MRDHIEEINLEVPRLIAGMASEFQLAETAWIAVLSFDKQARLRVGLTDIGRMGHPPVLDATVPWTSYEAAFGLLRSQIARDLYRLYTLGRRPYRPVVFFLSDGQPDHGDWQNALALLEDRSSFFGAPNIVAFGFGDASEEIIRTVGKRAAYMPEHGAPSANLGAFMTFIMNSLNKSTARAQRFDDEDILEIPDLVPAGWRPIRRA